MTITIPSSALWFLAGCVVSTALWIGFMYWANRSQNKRQQIGPTGKKARGR